MERSSLKSRTFWTALSTLIFAERLNHDPEKYFI
jgi:hypothetical protein